MYLRRVANKPTYPLLVSQDPTLQIGDEGGISAVIHACEEEKRGITG